MTTDGVAIKAEEPKMKMGPSMQTEPMDKFNDIAPMIILEPANGFYDTEQVIISNDLAITELSNSKFESSNLYINNTFDENHFSITVIENEKEEMGLISCYDSIDSIGNVSNVSNASFDALGSIIDCNGMPQVLSGYPEGAKNRQFEEKQTTEAKVVGTATDEADAFGSTGNCLERTLENDDKKPYKEGQGSLECILKNLLIESKCSDASQTVPCKRPAISSNSINQKKFKLTENDQTNKSKTNLANSTETEPKGKKANSMENVQILKIETKPPKPSSVDKDLTSLNWLHKLNIVSVPSLPTPPSSPTFHKNNFKKPNSLSLRLQYGKPKIQYYRKRYSMLIDMCHREKVVKSTLLTFCQQLNRFSLISENYS